uniref:Putative secreted protein n=1 Tax=Anopheles darlingi TaxID=43151 RepID=A0A2M4D4U5_ANODA
MVKNPVSVALRYSSSAFLYFVFLYVLLKDLNGKRARSPTFIEGCSRAWTPDESTQHNKSIAWQRIQESKEKANISIQCSIDRIDIEMQVASQPHGHLFQQTYCLTDLSATAFAYLLSTAH